MKELDIVKCSFTLDETLEDVGPACLLFVAVRKLDVCVRNGGAILWKFLEPDDDGVSGRLRPGVVLC